MGGNKGKHYFFPILQFFLFQPTLSVLKPKYDIPIHPQHHRFQLESSNILQRFILGSCHNPFTSPGDNK